MKNTTPAQTHTFETTQPTTEAIATRASIVTAAPASPTLKRSETVMQPKDSSEATTMRFAKPLATVAILCGVLFLFAATVRASTYVVINTNNSGAGSLREKIIAANADPSSTITFNIPGAGVHTINLTSALPDINSTVTIDGYSQPGASLNTQVNGSNALPLIELNGNLMFPFNITGLKINAKDSIIRGLVINHFGFAIQITELGGHTTVAGCFIGTNAIGNAAAPNGNGIEVAGSSDNIIGGSSLASRNLISGNTYNGVSIYGGQNTIVAGNLIGTDKSGTGAIGNDYGILVQQGQTNTIGAVPPLPRNVISGNLRSGVYLYDVTETLVIGNYIGTNAMGTGKVGNDEGVTLFGQADSNKIGIVGAGNVISGNLNDGISLLASKSSSPRHNKIIANLIGTTADGVGALGNGSNGVLVDGVESTNNKIGGDLEPDGNVIAFNENGVVVNSSGDTGNRINYNSIFSNTNLGIDLAPLGVNLNDLNDADTGPNNLQNFPVITLASTNGNTTTIAGTLNTEANNDYMIQVFTNSQCDQSGYGEGKTHLGIRYITAKTNDTSFSITFPATNIGDFVTATATSFVQGNVAAATSEFSQCKQIGFGEPGNFEFSPQVYNVSEAAGVATIAVVRSGGSVGAVSVQYATSSGTATFDVDYTAVFGTLNWANGDSAPKFFTVPLTNDLFNELNENVLLSLSNPTGGTVLGANKNGVLVITDDDPLPALSVSDVSLAEGNSGTTGFNFNVTLSAASLQIVKVDFATAGGTAASGVDFQPANNTLTFNPGETSKTVTVMVNGDTTNEPDESFFVNLSNVKDAAIAKAQGLGTIKNDDAPQSAGSLNFSAPTYNTNEDGASAAITVKRTGGSNGAVSVQYAGGGGTAQDGSDYTAASGTLNWADGDSSDKSFSVTILEDTLNEQGETINLSLSGPTGGATFGNQSTAVLTIADNDSQPGLSISDASLAEGNSGTTSFNFNVTLSAASGQLITVDYVTADGTAMVGNDYQHATGTLTFNPGETSKPMTVLVNGDTTEEPNETFVVNLSSPTNATLSKGQGAGTIINDDAPAIPSFGFSQANYSVAEGLSAMTVNVIRSGDASGAASVDYATSDGSATQKGDFEFAAGTLRFAAGEVSRTITILLNQDIYSEGPENFSLVLSHPAGAALGAQSVTLVSISDDLPEELINPIDDAESFVHTHYHDFLNREPDAAGFAFWTNQIKSCGNDAKCIEERRINVSSSFFLSIEFQETGYLRYLLQRESFGSTPKYAEFMRDVQELSNGVIVNSPGWEKKLQTNQQQFAEYWVNRPAFKAVYDAMSNADFVNAIYTNAGILPSQAKRESLVSALDANNESRSAVLLEVAADAAFRQKENNSAFVLMQYFGYLRRDPDASPDADLSGHNFWLNKLNQFGGNYIDAEMIKAFITSFEYRQRFAQ